MLSVCGCECLQTFVVLVVGSTLSILTVIVLSIMYEDDDSNVLEWSNGGRVCVCVVCLYEYDLNGL